MPPVQDDNKSPPTSESKGINHAYWLDWARFLAALVVCITHLRNEFWTDWAGLEPASRHVGTAALFAVGRLGHEAVLFFFVLSGYFVGGKCLQSLRARSFDPRRYSIDRITRIYPAYVGAIALSLIITWFFRPDLPLTPGSILGQLLFVQGVWVPVLAGNAPLWSLAYEVWFYVLAGGLCTLCSPQPQRLRMIAGLLIILAIIWIWKAETEYLACWLAGAVAYFAGSRLRHRAWLFAGILIAFAGVFILQSSAFQQGFTLPFSFTVPNGVWGTRLTTLGLALALPSLAARGPRSLALMRIESVGAPLAAFAYSLYLIHLPLIEVVLTPLRTKYRTFDVTSVGTFAILLMLLVLGAWGFSLVFEKPIPHFRAWLSKRCST